MMDKALKGLHQHCEGSMFDRCGECPYYEMEDEPFVCRDCLLLDVFDLMKEVEPTHSKVNGEGRLFCGNCGTMIKRWAKYCGECGRKVKRR